MWEFFQVSVIFSQTILVISWIAKADIYNLIVFNIILIIPRPDALYYQWKSRWPTTLCNSYIFLPVSLQIRPLQNLRWISEWATRLWTGQIHRQHPSLKGIRMDTCVLWIAVLSHKLCSSRSGSRVWLCVCMEITAQLCSVMLCIIVYILLVGLRKWRETLLYRKFWTMTSLPPSLSL